MKKNLCALMAFMAIALPSTTHALTYVKAGSVLINNRTTAPYFCIGERMKLGMLGLDVNWGVGAARKKQVGTFTTPRAALLLYLTPGIFCPIYVGAGGGWATYNHFKEKGLKTGWQIDVIAGMELDLFLCGGFVEYSRTMPQRGNKHPSTTISVGVGF